MGLKGQVYLTSYNKAEHDIAEMFYGNTAQKSRRDTARSDIIKTWINR